MANRPTGYWVAMAYLVATMIYNVIQWRALWPPPWDMTANLGLKVLGTVLLLRRRAEGVYFLAGGFVIGMSSTLVYYFQNPWSWQFLDAAHKLGRINGFVISFAIVAYMAFLSRRGVLKGRVIGITKGPADMRLTFSD